MESTKSPRYYFDLRKERKAGAKGESAFTPAIALMAALGAALDYLREAGEGDMAAGREALIANAELARRDDAGRGAKPGAEAVRQRARERADRDRRARGLDSGVIVKAFREMFGAVVAGGAGGEDEVGSCFASRISATTIISIRSGSLPGWSR